MQMLPVVSRTEVLNFRVRAQQLERESGELSKTRVLNIGVQDTGPYGATAIRGVDASSFAKAHVCALTICRST